MQKMTPDGMKSFALTYARGVKSAAITPDHRKQLASFFAAHTLDTGAQTLGFSTGDTAMKYNERLPFALKHAKLVAVTKTGSKNEDIGRFFWSLGYKEAAETLGFKVPTLAEQVPTVQKSPPRSQAAAVAISAASASAVSSIQPAASVRPPVSYGQVAGKK